MSNTPGNASRLSRNIDATCDQIIRNNTSEDITDVRGWYIAGTYRLQKRIRLGSYYSRYTITDAYRGALAAIAPDQVNTALPANHTFDTVATFRADLNRFWNVKIEGHFIDGYANAGYPADFYPKNNPRGFMPHKRPGDQDRIQLLTRTYEEDFPMIASSRLCLTAGFMLVEALTAFAGDVKVVANPSVRTSSITIAELRTVFLLQRKTLKEGSSVEPVLGRNRVTTEAFMKRYLNRDSEEVRTYYQGLVFTGKGSMPKQLNSDAEIVAYVARTKGAIGYVSRDSNTDQDKVLTITEEASLRRTLVKRIEPEYPETLQRK